MVNHASPRPHVKTPPIFLLFFQFPKNRPAGSVKQKIKLVWPNLPDTCRTAVLTMEVACPLDLFVEPCPAAQTATPSTHGISHSYLVLRDQRKGYLRGNLVEWSKDGYEYHSHFQLFLPPSNRTVGDSDLAPLTEEECLVLDSLPQNARFAVYITPGKLEWGVGLKVEDTVFARLPNSNGEYSTAIIRWISENYVRKYPFGVEIKVGECHSQWS